MWLISDARFSKVSHSGKLNLP